MRTDNIPNANNVIQRATVSTKHIMLTILHQVSGWERDALEEFDRQYIQMCRKARAKDKKTMADIRDTEKKMDIHLWVNRDDSVDTPEYLLLENTWRYALLSGLTVLKQTNDPEALWAVEKDFSDWMKAVLVNERDAIDVMNVTLRYLGKPEV